jgi:hypothetical protein
MKIARLGLGVSLGTLLLTLASAVPVSAAAPPAKPAAKKAAAPSGTAGKQPLCSSITPSCGTNCTNTPFEPTSCRPTRFGPARADVVIRPANMLSCQGDAYALCFFSGPPAGLFGGQPLPCVLGPGGLTADCTCQYYRSGTNYVDINGILNQGAYYQAVQQCGADGCECANAMAGKAGKCASSTKQATVCTYVGNQPKGDPASSFYPKSEVQIISTFSLAMTPPYQLAKKPPTCHGKYAGCMTAACRFTDGKPPSSHKDGDPIHCDCPVYDGDYQVGADGQACTIPSSNGKSYVWSASNTVERDYSSKK